VTADFLPREHGFWTMLGAVVLAALVRSELTAATLLTALGVAALSGVLGGVFRRAVRRHESLQLGSAALIGLAGVPIELVGKVDPASMTLTMLAWSVVFSASALSVRSSFARASRKPRSKAKAKALSLGAVVLPLFAATLFGVIGYAAQAVASLVAALGCATLGLARPGIKRMDTVGLSLAGVALLAALALALL
jgi:hypothetical protein